MVKVFAFLLLVFLPMTSHAYITEGPEGLGLFLLFGQLFKAGILGGIYLLPGLIALFRHAEKEKAIFITNFFTAWSLVGWCTCLIWAFTDRSGTLRKPAANGWS